VEDILVMKYQKMDISNVTVADVSITPNPLPLQQAREKWNGIEKTRLKLIAHVANQKKCMTIRMEK
jgi:hypothetical protein